MEEWQNIGLSRRAKNSSVSTCTPRGTSGVWLLLPFQSRLQGALPTPLGWVFTRTNGIVHDGVHRDLLWQSYKRHMVIVGDMIQKPPTLFFPDKGRHMSYNNRQGGGQTKKPLLSVSLLGLFNTNKSPSLVSVWPSVAAWQRMNCIPLQQGYQFEDLSLTHLTVKTNVGQNVYSCGCMFVFIV